ncbi:hypothetical protein NMY22_g12151 [Coprinellus aureogranulatus]|nr:hypothetical protein NMY22_g12151 [Coprinellus aureogranulatus]
MACLNKLAIRGIRSFDDKQISIIEFFSPVTVIVGHNGSGKTTIIECLKYATTGEQPPNTRGGAFVHDPKMANEKEVKAQVKLRFNAANGTRMLAVRNLSVTLKKTSGMTMKTLESILALADSNVEKGGKRGVISTKCAEMDAEIPQLLGVSKAVLENVIFCHQEDSYWPLAEPSTLKKKFDDIFEATRYTKALDNIKSLRKDRLADLKAEKERLVGLSKEKQRFDQLKGKIRDATTAIATKEVVYENTKAQYERVEAENRRFHEQNSKFREIYRDIEHLNHQKEEALKELESAREGNFEELPGTDEELALKMSQFNQHIEQQRQALLREDRNKQDIEDEIIALREQHTDLLSMKGRLAAEADAHRARMSERETLIRNAASQYNIPVPEQTPLQREQVVEVMSQLTDAQRRQRSEFERIQTEGSEKSDEYHAKIRKLENEVQTFKTQRQTLREQLQDRQGTIRSTERQLDAQSGLEITLRQTQEEIKDKRSRVDKVKSDISEGRHDEKIQQKAEQARRLEDKRESLLEESRVLSMQADSRAKLDLKRAEIKAKNAEIETTHRSVALKFQELTNQEPNSNSIEHDIDRVLHKKELEQEDIDRDATAARSALHNLETSLVNLKSEISAKQKEAREYEAKIWHAIDRGKPDGYDTLDEAIADNKEGLAEARDRQSSMAGSAGVFENILKVGQQKKHCMVCTRTFKGDEFEKFTDHVKFLIAKEAKSDPEAAKQEVGEWEKQVQALIDLKPSDIRRKELTEREIPALKERLAAAEDERPDLTAKAEALAEKLDDLKQLTKNLLILKQQTGTITRLRKEIERTENEVSDLETELTMTGTTRTVDDVQTELNEITTELRGIEKDRTSLSAEKERLQAALRSYESKCHQLELEEQKSLNKLNELKALSERQEQMKQDVVAFQAQIKELDVKITAAQAPIEDLVQEHKRVQEEYNGRLTLSQTRLQDLNMAVDRISTVNKQIERYVKEKRGRGLDECLLNISQCEQEIDEANARLEDCRSRIKAVEKQISDAGASNANLRENIRIRKLRANIAKWENEMKSLDVVEAAKARQNFDDNWPKMKDRENQLNTEHNQLRGELTSMRANLKDLENELKEDFKDVIKNYTDQLIRVKVRGFLPDLPRMFLRSPSPQIADMANSDLEKYAKALDK